MNRQSRRSRPNQPARYKLYDALFASALILYVIAGMMLAPFHGDESTIMHKARDWFLLTSRDLAALAYNPNLTDKADQELRLVNGSVSAYGMGLSASLAGLGIQDINSQWEWGADWNYNLGAGHIPGAKLLFAARLSSTLMIALSVAVVFAIARRLGGRTPAWIASAIYATMPAVLLNGRRAMFEGATLLAESLIILAGIEALRHQRKPRAWLYYLLLGIVAGFGIASKHTLLLTILPVFAVLLWLGRRDLIRSVGRLALAGITMAAVLLALNPAWWSAPLQVPAEVIRLRQNLTGGQAEFYGGYNSLGERITALFDNTTASPQFYEDKRGWPEWIGSQIAAYDGSLLGGIAWPPALILFLVMISAAAVLLPGIHRPNRAILGLFYAVLLFTAITIFVLTPVPWQRYYLPLAALWAIFFGLGLQAMWQFWQNWQVHRIGTNYVR